MSPSALDSISQLDQAIDSLTYPVMIKAGPKLWSALKVTGRAHPCTDRVSILKLDERFNVQLDGFQDSWGFSILKVGAQKEAG